MAVARRVNSPLSTAHVIFSQHATLDNGRWRDRYYLDPNTNGARTVVRRWKGCVMEFQQQQCTPCRGGIPPLTADEAWRFATQVPDWLVQDQATRLVRAFIFPDYAQALALVTAISAVAEAEGHHPDICFGWGYVTVSLHTHAIDGLHENDFLLATKFDRLVENRRAILPP